MKRHELAEQDFIRGMTTAKIAKKYGVKTVTVYSWHKKYNWVKKREKLKDRMQSTLYKRFIDHTSRSMDNYLKATELVGEICLERIQKISPDSTSAAKEIAKWMNILQQASKIHRNIIPDANDRIATAILEELRQLNKDEDQN